jgi:DNA-binding CsgD family transcriptional regulator
MLGIEIKTRQLLVGILLVVFINLIGKQIIQNDLIYLLASIMILTILIKAIGREKVTWMRAFWAIFIAMAAVLIGSMVILTPLSLIPAITKFKLTPLAAVFGSACDGVLPAILLFLLKTLNLSIIPPVKRRFSSLDIGNLIIFVIPFIWLYQDFLRTFRNLEKYNQLELLGDFLFQLLLAGGLVITYYWVYSTTTKRFKMQLQAIEGLEKQNSELTELNNNLKSVKLTPQRLYDDVANLISGSVSVTRQLRTLNETLKTQSESGGILKNEFLAGMTFNEIEIKIIERIVEGETNAEIGEALGLSAGRVRNIVTDLLNKTGSRDRTVLAVQYVKSKFKK